MTNRSVYAPLCPEWELLQPAVSTHTTRRVLGPVVSLPGSLTRGSPVVPVTLACNLAEILEELPVGVSISHLKSACPLKVCVLISWPQCCLLVAILLLINLTRTTWAVGCWPWMTRSGALSSLGLLVPHPVSWLSRVPCGLHCPVPSPQLPFCLGLRLPKQRNAHGSGLVVSHMRGASPGLAGEGDLTGSGV